MISLSLITFFVLALIIEFPGDMTGSGSGSCEVEVENDVHVGRGLSGPNGAIYVKEKESRRKPRFDAAS